jgi:hypothetical protein
VDPLLGLLLLWAFSKGKGGAPAPGGSLWPSPSPGKPADKGGGGASKFPVSPAPPSVPPRSRSGGNWKPYPAPIPAAVVARAQALLRDPTMAINAERLEPDPAGSGQVRYWKVNAPPGKVSVTAWKPSLAQARPAGNPPPGQHVLRSTLSTTRPTNPAAQRSKAFPGRPGARGAGGGPGFAR